MLTNMYALTCNLLYLYKVTFQCGANIMLCTQLALSWNGKCISELLWPPAATRLICFFDHVNVMGISALSEDISP